jgi:hypothetical protein
MPLPPSSSLWLAAAPRLMPKIIIEILVIFMRKMITTTLDRLEEKIMSKKHMLLRDVARILKRKPYQISYAISVGLVPEPELRISNKRIFQAEDIDRLAAYFGIVLAEKPRRKERDE